MNNYAQQPAIESMPVAKQPMASSTMSKWTLYERKSTVTWDKRQCDANSQTLPKLHLPPENRLTRPSDLGEDVLVSDLSLTDEGVADIFR
jgi:hypothetical protein